MLIILCVGPIYAKSIWKILRNYDLLIAGRSLAYISKVSFFLWSVFKNVIQYFQSLSNLAKSWEIVQWKQKTDVVPRVLLENWITKNMWSWKVKTQEKWLKSTASL